MNKKEFMENVKLSDDGLLEVEQNTQVGSATTVENQYEFYKKIALNEDGQVKIVIVNN